MTEEKVEYFNEERKRFEEVYSMTPENSDLTAVEIVQKQEENKYAHEGFSEAYSQVMYIMSNNQGKGSPMNRSWFMKKAISFVRR